MATSGAWQPTEHPRIQVKQLGPMLGWISRYWTDVPATRVRCADCGKDIVPKNDGSLHKHVCEANDVHGWKVCQLPLGRGYNIRALAIDAAARRANIPEMKIQLDWTDAYAV